MLPARCRLRSVRGTPGMTTSPLPDGFLGKVRRAVDAVPVVSVLVRALGNYIVHQSANQAGSVAFSAVLSMFPLLLLVATAASWLGAPGDAAALAGRVLGYAPGIVREALQPVVD